jgi:hypothetical protein
MIEAMKASQEPHTDEMAYRRRHQTLFNPDDAATV